MRFLATPEPRRHPPRAPRERRWWLPVLFLSAIAVAFATRWPWLQVQFERLFQQHMGPPGWHTTAGFTCLCTSALVAVMALAETRTQTSREAVRPGSLMITALAFAALAFEVLSGPGNLRGVSAIWTPWFYVACVGLPILLAVCVQRCRALQAMPNGGDPSEPPGYSSSGPPT